MFRTLCIAALLTVANAGCKEICAKSSSDASFVKGYIAKAESAAGALAGSLTAVDSAKTNAAKAGQQAAASKEAHDNSGFLGFFKDDETVMNLDQVKKSVADSTLDSALVKQDKAEKAMAKANKSMRGAAKFQVTSCTRACEAAVAAAKKAFQANPSNKFGVSVGLSLAAAGKAA